MGVRHRFAGRLWADRIWAPIATAPVRDAWQRSWTYRFASFALFVQHLMVLVCSLMWFVSPSASIEASLDPLWSGAWSALFAVFTLIGLVARIRRVPIVEASCNIVVAIAVWLWAMTVLVVTLQASNGGLQTAFMLLAFAANLWGWSLIQIGWTRRRETEADLLKLEVAALLATERQSLASAIAAPPAQSPPATPAAPPALRKDR